MDKDQAAAPEQREELPEPVAWLVCSVNGDGSLMVEHSTAWEQAAHDHINDAINEHDIEDAATWVVRPAYTADQLRTAIAAERERVRLEHARELVEAHREAFVGNIEALSKLDLDAMNAQPLLMAVQNWDISTGRARELLRCWVLGTFKPDMLPECGDELFAEADEPRDAWAKLQAELSTLRQQLAEAGRDGWTDAEADAARLALELECLLTDKDVPMPALSRWWDSAHEALELHRARFRTAIAAQGETKPPAVERELFEGE